MSIRVLTTVGFIVYLLIGAPVIAQTSTVVGTLELDAGPFYRDLNIEIVVRNHALIVVPPSFSILRPITSQRSVSRRVPKGTSRVSFRVEGILPDAVNHSIQLRCVGCSADMPRQFFTSNGNALTLIEAAYIDPADLTGTVSMTANTLGFIEGEFLLDELAQRTWRFNLRIDDGGPSPTQLSSKTILIDRGQARAVYRVSGLPRSGAGTAYRAVARCTNCIGRSAEPRLFSRSLTSVENHAAINFRLTDLDFVPLTPSIELLLSSSAAE